MYREKLKKCIRSHKEWLQLESLTFRQKEYVIDGVELSHVQNI